MAIEDVASPRAGGISGAGRGPQESHEAPSPHGSLVDPYVGRYAARAQEMVASEIRALFAVAGNAALPTLRQLKEHDPEPRLRALAEQLAKDVE